jgi:hypothetical protein
MQLISCFSWSFLLRILSFQSSCRLPCFPSVFSSSQLCGSADSCLLFPRILRCLIRQWSHFKCSESKGTDGDEDKYSDEDYDGDAINSHSRDEGSTAVASNGPSPAAAILATVRYASTDAAESLEYFGLGEVAQSNRSRCLELVATKLLPTSSPIAHLAVSSSFQKLINIQALYWHRAEGINYCFHFLLWNAVAHAFQHFLWSCCLSTP